MTKTKEELNELKIEYEALNNKLKELSEEEIQMVAGGAVDFDVPIIDEATHYLMKAYNLFALCKNEDSTIFSAYCYIESALSSNNNKNRLADTKLAISILDNLNSTSSFINGIAKKAKEYLLTAKNFLTNLN